MELDDHVLQCSAQLVDAWCGSVLFDLMEQLMQ